MIRIIKTKEAFFLLQDEWKHLLSLMEEPCIFLTWEWMYTWWNDYCSGNSSCELFIITFYNERGELIGILPTYLKKCWGLWNISNWQLQFLGGGFESPDHLDIISEVSHRESFLRATLSYLKKLEPPIDFIAFHDLRGSSPTIDLLLKITKEYHILSKKYIASVCPYLKLPDHYEKYLSTLSSKFRFNLKRYTKIVLEKDKAQFVEVKEKEELNEKIDKLFSLHDMRWQNKKMESGFSHDKIKEFHMHLSHALLDRSYLRFFYLGVQSEIIACLYCFEYHHKLYYYQSGFDPDWSKKSVGTVLIGKIIEKSIAEGKEEFDFLRGDEEYKTRWTRDARETCHIEMGLTLKGKIIFSYKNLIRSSKIRMKAFLYETNILPERYVKRISSLIKKKRLPSS
jgi:hypothetical protein